MSLAIMLPRLSTRMRKLAGGITDGVDAGVRGGLRYAGFPVSPFPTPATPATPAGPAPASPENAAWRRVAGMGLTGALVGGGIAATAALVKRLSEPSEEAEDAAARSRSGSHISLKRATTPATHSSEVPWTTPLGYGAAVLGTGLGYTAIRKLFDKQRQSDLAARSQKAEQSFNDAISGALQPQGLRLAVKAGSLAILSDEDACLVVLDAAATTKSADLGDLLQQVAAWGAIPMGVAAGVGAMGGWGIADSKNPYKKQLKAIRTRELLSSLNTPSTPVLTLKEDEDENDSADQPAAATTPPPQVHTPGALHSGQPQDETNGRVPMMHAADRDRDLAADDM